MGSNISSTKNIKENVFLQKLVSDKNIPIDDNDFWNEFLSFAMPNLDDLW